MNEILNKRNKRKKNIKSNIAVIEILTFLYFCKQSCTNLATAVGFSTAITAGVILISFVLLFVYYFLKNLHNIKWDALGLYAACALLFVVTIKFHPEYMPRFEDVYNDGRFSAKSVFSLGAGIYTYYIIRLYENDSERLYSVFKRIPYILFFFNLGTIFNHKSEYSMDFGYQMEIAAILFIAQFLFEKKQTSKLFFSFTAIFLGIIYGSRACVIGYVIFIVLALVWKHKVSFKKFLLVCIGAAISVMYSSQTIMFAIYNFIRSFGIDSRTLYLIASGDIMAVDTSRQDNIWPVLDEVLKNSGFFEMHGAYGDRYFINPYYPYAHNIVYEILITFGKCIGSILLILLIYNFARIFVKDKGKGGLLTLIFGVFSLSRLFFSSSFWIEPYFWAFLAIMVNCRINAKKLSKSAKKLSKCENNSNNEY